MKYIQFIHKLTFTVNKIIDDAYFYKHLHDDLIQNENPFVKKQHDAHKSRMELFQEKLKKNFFVSKYKEYVFLFNNNKQGLTMFLKDLNERKRESACFFGESAHINSFLLFINFLK